MKAFYKNLIILIILYIISLILVYSYNNEGINVAISPLDYGAVSNNSLFPCVTQPLRTITIKPLDIGKIKDKFYLKMDWGFIDEKFYSAVRFNFYSKYIVKNPDTRSGALPTYYEMSLDGTKYKKVSDKIAKIGYIRLNQPQTIYIISCLIPTCIVPRHLS